MISSVRSRDNRLINQGLALDDIFNDMLMDRGAKVLNIHLLEDKASSPSRLGFLHAECEAGEPALFNKPIQAS
jgi:hypothetical protein